MELMKFKKISNLNEVKFLNRKILLIFTLVISLSSAKIAMANENHQNQYYLASSGQGTNHSHDINSGSDMKGMDMSGNQSMKDSNQGDNMSGMDMEKDGQSHDPVQEQAPNVKVLGTYGVINLLLIVIGVWNKWFRRKDGLHVASK